MAWVLFPMPTFVHAQSAAPILTSPLPELVQWLRARPNGRSDEHLRVARTALERAAESGNDAWHADACVAVARALYVRGAQTESLRTMEQCADALGDLRRQPSAYVRFVTAHATLMMINGKAQDARAMMETLLDEDLSGADPADVRRLRGNYAAVLRSSGEVARAIAILGDTLGEAMLADRPEDQVALGNNLVVLLVEERLYGDAASWISRLKPALDSVPVSHFVLSLRLHEIQLHGILSDPEVAVVQFREFIETYDDMPPVLRGSAAEYLADLLCDLGRLEESESAAREAVRYLAAYPIEQGDAYLSLVHTLIERGKLSEAREQLEAVSALGNLSRASRERLAENQLRLALAERGEVEMSTLLATLTDERETRERTLIEQHSRYFDARLETERQSAKLERLERSQALLAARAAASAAQASENAARVAVARQTRNLTIVSSASSVILLALLSYLWAQRRFDRRLRQEQATLTTRLEQEVRLQSDALAKRAHVEALGQLTGNVAHDFNNLLQVMGIANERLERVAKDPESRRLLDGSNRALQNARAIIGQLLAYARQQSLDSKPFRVSSFLSEVRPLLEAAIGGQVTMEMVDEAGDACIGADDGQLTTALLNLLRNASDAMPDGGHVQVICGIVEVAEDNSAGWDLPAGEYLEISVSDTGEGMTGAQVERACEPFFSTKPEASGTGLGLSSVYGFVRQSRGDLRIESVVGAGTTVTLRFPSVEGQPQERREPVRADAELTGLSILLVEDNVLLAEALEAMVAHLGARVTLVLSGDAALERLRAGESFDLVLSDVRMPGGFDGFALAAWIEDQRPNLPVVLMSGFSEGDKLTRKVMRKPFTEAELKSHLLEALEQGRA